jgi:hypothetical protein
MTNVAFQRNIGSFLAGGAAGLTGVTATAGGANDNVALVGLTVDRNNIGAGRLCLSGALCLPMTTTLAAGQTVTVTCTFEDSANGTVWAAYDGGPLNRSQVFGGTGANTRFVIINCQLGGARRYIRANPKFDLSAGGTDTAVIGAGMWIFGGIDELPLP